MHNIDRTQAEMAWQGESYGAEVYPEVYGEMYGESGETYGEVYPEVYGEAGFYETAFSQEAAFEEGEMDELAAELLSVSNESEMDQFLGKLFRTVRRAIPKAVLRPLGGVLKGIARTALPIAGGALGSLVAPGIGTALGSSLAAGAGRMFGLEVEGLSGEDQEFQVARRYVQFAKEAARQAAGLAQAAPAPQAVQQAVTTAARQFAPGLLQGGAAGMRVPAVAGGMPGPRGRAGRWVRRGRTIILYGA